MAGAAVGRARRGPDVHSTQRTPGGRADSERHGGIPRDASAFPGERFRRRACVRRSSAPRSAREFAAAHAPDGLALAPQVVAEFTHVVTDPRRSEMPLSVSEALGRSRRWWNAREVRRELHDSSQPISGISRRVRPDVVIGRPLTPRSARASGGRFRGRAATQALRAGGRRSVQARAGVGGCGGACGGGLFAAAECARRCAL